MCVCMHARVEGALRNGVGMTALRGEFKRPLGVKAA